ncbi:MAG: hypothetical protein GDA50_03505 [Alphaproteobacteria bacterium GM202ARS2]|nr:hypothetical protein [Alphaproteobacteria bacterium GM202ARS2]
MSKSSERDTYNYELKQGRMVVYRGITKDPADRELRHLRSAKIFTHMRVDRRVRTYEEAKKKKRELLVAHRTVYGENPKYNKAPDPF